MIKVIKNKIAIEKLDAPQITESGLHLPLTAAQEQCISGKIVALGPKAHQVNIFEGQTVHFSTFAANVIKSGNQEYYILSVDNILAIE